MKISTFFLSLLLVASHIFLPMMGALYIAILLEVSILGQYGIALMILIQGICNIIEVHNRYLK